MLSNLKNIAKTMEGYSKSHFSHIRNEVEKSYPETSFFGEVVEANIVPKSEKVIPKSS